MTAAGAGRQALHGNPPLRDASMVLDMALARGALAAASRHDAGRLVPSASFDTAIALYERCDWKPAFDLLQRLADAGDALAARLALLMLRYGTLLYGTAFDASPRQIAAWARAVLAERP